MAIRVTLKEIYECHFGRSEMTNYREWQKETGRTLAAGEAVCLVSITGNQMVFVWKPITISVGKKRSQVFLSIRVRLDKDHWWEPRMLANYASQVGLDLVGLKRYEEYYRAYAE